MPAEPDGPLHWPSLQPEDTDQPWAELRAWVQLLVERFPLTARVIPPCWYRHNHLVETLSALRDYERASFHPRSSPAAAYDFVRTVAEAEHLLSEWTGRTGCTAGEHHDTPVRGPLVDDEEQWQSVVESDLAYRRALAAAIDRAANPQQPFPD